MSKLEEDGQPKKVRLCPVGFPSLRAVENPGMLWQLRTPTNVEIADVGYNGDGGGKALCERLSYLLKRYSK
jgi:hypothetical protein